MTIEQQHDETAWLKQAFLQRPLNKEYPDCPAPGTLFAAATGEATKAEREQIIDHLATCARCAQAWQLASALDAQEPNVASRDTTNKIVPLKPRVARTPVALAAAATLLFGVSLTVVQYESPPTDNYRGGPVTPDQAAQPTLVNDGSTLHIAWPTMANRTLAEFELHIFDPDFNVLFRQTHLGSASFTVNIEEFLAPHATVYWQIEATLSDGTSVTSQSSVVKITKR